MKKLFNKLNTCLPEAIMVVVVNHLGAFAQGPADKEWRLLFYQSTPGIKEQFISSSLAISDGSSLHALVHEVTSLGCDYPHSGVARVSKTGQLLWTRPSCGALPDYSNIHLYEDYLGRYVVAGSSSIPCSSGPNLTLIYCLDSLGQFHYCRQWGGLMGPVGTQVNSVLFSAGAPTRDGGFLIAGSQSIGGYGNSTNSGTGGFVYRLGPAGDSLWKVINPIPDSLFPITPLIKRVYIYDIMENEDSTISLLGWLRVVVSPNHPDNIEAFGELKLKPTGAYLTHKLLNLPANFFGTSSCLDDCAKYFVKPKHSNPKIVMAKIYVTDKPGYDKQVLLEYDTAGQVLWMLNLYKPEGTKNRKFFLPDSTILIHQRKNVSYYPFNAGNYDNNNVNLLIYYLARYDLSGNLLGEQWDWIDLKPNEWYSARSPTNQNLSSPVTPDSCILLSGRGWNESYPNERGIYYVEKRCRDVFLRNHDQAEGGQEEEGIPLVGYDGITGEPVPVVYPNPGTGQYRIGYAKPLQRLRVWDVQGVLVLDGRPEGRRFSLEGRPAGLYVWEVTDSEGRIHRGKLMQQGE